MMARLAGGVLCIAALAIPAAVRADDSPVPAAASTPPPVPFASPAADAAQPAVPRVPVTSLTPAPSNGATPWPTLPQNHETVDVEAGGTNDWLNSGRGMWHNSYLATEYANPSGFKAQAFASDNVRFGLDDASYGGAVYVPTPALHGTANFGYAFSPQHNNLPGSDITGGYDLRLPDSYGIQVQYENRAYTSENAAIWDVGADRYFGNDRLAYVAVFATLNNVPGTAFSQTVSYQKVLSHDRITFAANIGRDVENTGNNHIAVYDSAYFALDEMHWIDSNTAVHAGVAYNALSGAYQRYEVLLGLRERF